MKILYSKLFLCLFLLISYTSAMRAQPLEEEYPKNLIKLNVLGLPVGNIPIFYERVIGAHNALWFGFNYHVNNMNAAKDMELWSVATEYRFYLGNHAAPKGFFLAPYLKYQDIVEKKELPVSAGVVKNAKIEVNTLGAGGTIGYQFIFNRVVLSGFAGIGYNFLIEKSGDTENFSDSDYTIDPRFGLSIGYGF